MWARKPHMSDAVRPEDKALILDFGGVISRTLFETHALSEAALGLAAGKLTWQGPFAPEADALWQADCLLPMPLSRQRLAERGFNQALLLCQCLAPAKTQAHSLLKMRHTPAQSQLKREERLLNLKGALVLDPLRAPALRGKRVILVDDVMTSGATLNTAALVLKQAGAAHVAGLVFARTEAGAHDAPVANSQHNTGYVPYHFG